MPVYNQITDVRLRQVAENLSSEGWDDDAEYLVALELKLLAVLKLEAELQATVDHLEQAVSDIRDNADTAYRRGHWAGSNGK